VTLVMLLMLMRKMMVRGAVTYPEVVCTLEGADWQMGAMTGGRSICGRTFTKRFQRMARPLPSSCFARDSERHSLATPFVACTVVTGCRSKPEPMVW